MDTQICSHCGKQVSSQSFTLHEAHCRRNYEHCECGQFIKLSDKQMHFSEMHTTKTCTHCNLEAPAYLLPLHDCSNKPRVCQFCHAEISLDEFKEHLYVCSSRTQHCDLCLKYIPNRDFEHHSAVCTGSIVEHASPTSANLPANVDTDLIRAQLLSEGKTPDEADMLLAVRVAEEMDRAYAEHIERKLLEESIKAEHMEQRRKVSVASRGAVPMDAEHEAELDEFEDSPHEEADPPSSVGHDSELSEALRQSLSEEAPQEAAPQEESHESQEDRDLNEAILKSLSDK